MAGKYFLITLMSLFSIYLLAMQEQQKTFSDLDGLTLKTIARYLDHAACVNVRQTCRNLNASFWNDTDPIIVSLLLKLTGIPLT